MGTSSYRIRTTNVCPGVCQKMGFPLPINEKAIDKPATSGCKIVVWDMLKLANGIHSNGQCLPLAAQLHAFAERGRVIVPNFQNHFSCNRCNTTSTCCSHGMQSVWRSQRASMIGLARPFDQCAANIFACICYCHWMRTQSMD